MAGPSRPFGPENPDRNPLVAHPEEDASASTLRQGGTARPSCPSTALPGILGCVLPSLSAAAAAVAAAAAAADWGGGEVQERPFPWPTNIHPIVHLHTVTSSAPTSEASSLFASSTPHACYIPSRPSSPYSFFLTFHFVTTSVPTGRKAFTPSLHLPVKRPSLRTFPSTALESSTARATCQSLPQSYQILTPPLQSNICRPRGSPPPHHTFLAACIIHSLRSWSCITPTRARSPANLSTLTRSLLS